MFNRNKNEGMENSSFNDRLCERTLTSEFLENIFDASFDEVQKVIIEQVTEFERSFNAVAMVKFQKTHAEGGHATITVIRSKDANPETIKRGIEELESKLYRTAMDRNPDK